MEIKNQAENLIFQSEKTLGEVGDKITDEEKKDVQAEIDRLKELVKNGRTDEIKAGTEALQKKFYAVSEKLYQQNAQNAGAGGQEPQAHKTRTAPTTQILRIKPKIKWRVVPER